MVDAVETEGFDDAAGHGSSAEVRAPAPEQWTGRERRLNIRIFEHWDELLHGREFPSVADLDSKVLEPYRDHSLLIDFTHGYDQPVLRYVGKTLREECGLAASDATLTAAPRGSMLSRLTDHYMEILANRAPIGFEAEFVNARGILALYRGILVPLSDDGEQINFIYGALSWKEVDLPGSEDYAGDDELYLTDDGFDAADAAMILDEASSAERAEPSTLARPRPGGDWNLDSLVTEIDAALTEQDLSPAPAGEILELSLEDEISDDIAVDGALLVDPAVDPTLELRGIALDPPVDDSASLSARLAACRAAAQAVEAEDSRSRKALYAALGEAYDFFHASAAAADEYAALLAAAKIKSQERAPFTPVLKLAFGKDYDKARITEYAACLSYAARQTVARHGLVGFLDAAEGGIKACVKAERAARRAEAAKPGPDPLVAALSALRHREALAELTLPDAAGDDREFLLLLARREPDGVFSVIGDAQAGDATIEAAVKKAARRTDP